MYMMQTMTRDLQVRSFQSSVVFVCDRVAMCLCRRCAVSACPLSCVLWCTVFVDLCAIDQHPHRIALASASF